MTDTDAMPFKNHGILPETLRSAHALSARYSGNISTYVHQR